MKKRQITVHTDSSAKWGEKIIIRNLMDEYDGVELNIGGDAHLIQMPDARRLAKWLLSVTAPNGVKGEK